MCRNRNKLIIPLLNFPFQVAFVPPFADAALRSVILLEDASGNNIQGPFGNTIKGLVLPPRRGITIGHNGQRNILCPSLIRIDNQIR